MVLGDPRIHPHPHLSRRTLPRRRPCAGYAGHRRRPDPGRRCPRVPDVRLRSLDRAGCPGPKSVSPSTPIAAWSASASPLTPRFQRRESVTNFDASRRVTRRVGSASQTNPANCSLRRTRPTTTCACKSSQVHRTTRIPMSSSLASRRFSRAITSWVSHLREGSRGTSPTRRIPRDADRAGRIAPHEIRTSNEEVVLIEDLHLQLRRRQPGKDHLRPTPRLTGVSPTVRRPAPTQCAIPTFLCRPRQNPASRSTST